MSTIAKSTFTFLKALKENNNREWFQANKAQYEEAKLEFEQFIEALIGEISKFDPTVAHRTAKESVFRIYRDVRFSKDKSPYKTNLGAHITSARKKSEIHSRAGYYIHRLRHFGISFLNPISSYQHEYPQDKANPLLP